MTEPSSLSPTQIVRALRVFLATAVLWGAWARASGIGAAILTGYVLWLGGNETDCAVLLSVTYLTSLVQIPVIKHTAKVVRKRALVIACGFFEMLFRFSIIGIPWVFDDVASRLVALYVIVSLGLVFGYLLSPILNDWLALTIPENIRAKFTSQRTFANTLTAMICGYLFGKFLDLYPESDPQARLAGFGWVFLAGLITGISGYLLLLRAPMPDMSGEEDEGILDALAGILHNKSFVRLLAFVVLYHLSMGLSMPFYQVFMLQSLKLDYATIAVYQNIALVATMVSFRPFGMLVDRFGSKPVMLMLLVPGALGQILRVFTSPDNSLMFPVSMALYAVMQAGISVALSPMLYGLLPRQAGRASYFAAWSCTVNIFAAIGPILGSVLASRLAGFQQNWFGFQVGNLQLVFVITTLGLLALFPLLWRMEERKAQSVGWLVSQVSKGRTFAYLYNLFAITHFGGEEDRSRAAIGIARSGNPMAADELTKALTDISPEVRKRAAEGLGILRSEEGVAPLISQIADPDSDIRAEAAEALGRIKHPLGLDALLAALDDADPRVRISAVGALGEIGGTGIQNLLYDLAAGKFDRQVLPTLVDVLSRHGDVRVVRVALQRLNEYHSPVIRAQLLNSVCRALGAGEQLYRLAVLDELSQASRIGSALEKAARGMDGLRHRFPQLHPELSAAMGQIRRDFEEGRYELAYAGMVRLVRQIGEKALGLRATSDSGEFLALTRGAAGALLMFDDLSPDEKLGHQELVFATICLCLAINALKVVQPA